MRSVSGNIYRENQNTLVYIQ